MAAIAVGLQYGNWWTVNHNIIFSSCTALLGFAQLSTLLTRPSHPCVCLFAYLTGDHFASLHLRHWIVFLAILFSHCCPLAGYLSSCSQKMCWYVGNKSKLIEWFFWGYPSMLRDRSFMQSDPKNPEESRSNLANPQGSAAWSWQFYWCLGWSWMVFDKRCMSKVQEHDLFKLFPTILK